MLPLVRAAIFSVAVGAIGLAQPSSKPPLRFEKVTVCQILAKVTGFDQKLVEVRGRYSGDGFFESLEPCKGEIQIGSKIYREHIWLEWPSEFSPAPFPFSALSDGRFRGAARRAKLEKEDLILTIRGQIHARTDPRLYDWGFGPGDDAPCELVMAEVLDFALMNPRVGRQPAKE